ncbi:MAG: hypothetical protein COB53_07555 [Elusimicrobia bacterium]|nr:MAG: hypothetical protein COB53_07555 [Elusimicrobiota bacterium]
MTASRKHPDLYTFGESHIHETVRGKDPRLAAREVSEQIHTLPLFTPEFCEKLIEEIEACGQWEAGLKINFFEAENEDTSPPGLKNGHSLGKLPGLAAVYNQIIDRCVIPVTEPIWETFETQMYRTPYVVKYDASNPELPVGMAPHWDQCGLSMFVSLNEDYKGGGTRFRQWNFETGKLPAGTALIFPGGISHEHEGRPVTQGHRYVLICDFF